MSTPKTQREYLELSHEDRAKVPTGALINILSEDLTSEDDNKEDEPYYPKGEDFEKMSEAEWAKLTTEERLEVLNETPQKREKK